MSTKSEQHRKAIEREKANYLKRHPVISRLVASSPNSPYDRPYNPTAPKMPPVRLTGIPKAQGSPVQGGNAPVRLTGIQKQPSFRDVVASKLKSIAQDTAYGASHPKEVAREIPNAMRKVDKQLRDTTDALVKGTARLPFTLATKALISFKQGITGKNEQLTPTTPSEKFLLGDRPIISAQKTFERGKSIAKSTGLSEKGSILAGGGLAIGSIAADFFPGFGGNVGKRMVKDLVKAKTESQVAKIAEKYSLKGLTETTAKRLATATDEKAVSSVLKDVSSGLAGKTQVATKDSLGRFTGSTGKSTSARMAKSDPARDALSESIQNRMDVLGRHSQSIDTAGHVEAQAARRDLAALQERIPRAKVSELPAIKAESDRITQEFLDYKAGKFRPIVESDKQAAKIKSIVDSSGNFNEFQLNMKRSGEDITKTFQSKADAQTFFNKSKGIPNIFGGTSKGFMKNPFVKAEDAKESTSLLSEARKYKTPEEFVKAQDDRYKSVVSKWGGDNYREHLKDSNFIDEFKKVFETHSEPVTNFREYSKEISPGRPNRQINYRDLLEYKKVLPEYNKPYIKTEEDAINWVKENFPDKISEVQKEIEYAKKIKIPDGYIPFSIGYDGENALKDGISTRPLSVSYAGKNAYEGQKVVRQFGKNTGYVYINKNSYLLPIKNGKYSDYEKELVIPIGSKIKNINTGYTGYGTRQFNTFVDTPDNIRTKSQLTDIWKQAHSGTKSTLKTSKGFVRNPFVKSETPKAQNTRPRTEPIVPEKPLQSEKASSTPKGTPKGEPSVSIQSSKRSYSENKYIKGAYSNTFDLSSVVGKERSLKKIFANTREYVQDSWIKVKKLQNAEGIVKNKSLNPYEAKKLYPGRLSARLESTKNQVSNIDKEVIKASKDSGISSDEMRKAVNEYLVAKHAPERNLIHGDRAAGMSTKEASDIVAKVESSKNSGRIKELASKVKALNDETLKILRDGQVISDETFNNLRNVYKNHVPLNRILPETENLVQVLGGGKGLNVRGTGIRAAKGSDKEVADILTNAFSNVGEAIARAEKNRVDLATLEFARNNKSTGLFTEIKPKAIGQTFSGKPILEKVTDKQVLTMRENGKPVYLRINDPKFAAVFQGVNQEALPGYIRAIGTFTRFYASLATRFKPDFVLSNKVRDLQDMLINVAADKNGGFISAAKAAKNDPGSFKAVYEYIRGADTPGAKLYKQMKLDGGTTGGMSLSTRKDLEIDVENIRKINRSNPRKAAETLLNGIEHWNTLFEDSTRLSVYKEALNKGLSRDAAAVMAKDSTLDFNTKGTAGSVVNALYMFSNASIQGSTTILRSLKNPKVAAPVIAIVGASTYKINRWNDSVDPEWRDKVSKWDRVSNQVVMVPTNEGTRYFTIPVSWGLKPLKVMMDEVYDVSVGKGKSILESSKNIAAAAIDAYNPVGGSDLMSSITPTILDTPLDLARNKKWSGSLIKPDWMKGLPNSDQKFDSINNSTIGKVLDSGTTKLSEKTGRILDFSPNDIQYALEQYVGGAGRFVEQSVNTVASGITGNIPQARDIPFVSRFFKTRTQQETESAQKRAGATDIMAELRKFKTGSAEQKKVMQDYLLTLPDNEARQSKLYILRENGFDTKGVSSSESVTLGKPIYEKVESLKNDKTKLDAYIKTLNPDDVKNYKSAKAAATASKTLELHKKYASDIQKIAETYASGDKKGAESMLLDYPEEDRASIISGVKNALKKR